MKAPERDKLERRLEAMHRQGMVRFALDIDAEALAKRGADHAEAVFAEANRALDALESGRAVPFRFGDSRPR